LTSPGWGSDPCRRASVPQLIHRRPEPAFVLVSIRHLASGGGRSHHRLVQSPGREAWYSAATCNGWSIGLSQTAEFSRCSAEAGRRARRIALAAPRSHSRVYCRDNASPVVDMCVPSAVLPRGIQPEARRRVNGPRRGPLIGPRAFQGGWCCARRGLDCLGSPILRTGSLPSIVIRQSSACWRVAARTATLERYALGPGRQPEWRFVFLSGGMPAVEYRARLDLFQLLVIC
jgi:hypothetical protein